MAAHTPGICGVAWSPDGSKLATASWDNTTNVWDVDTGRVLFTLSGHQTSVVSVAWSPDGSKLATASGDKTAKVWEAHSGHELFTLAGHQEAVDSVAWSPDGKRLASVSRDGTAQIYAIDHRELFELVRSRITRSLTSEECRRYLSMDRCPAE
jgi:WD40 repeat protein